MRSFTPHFCGKPPHSAKYALNFRQKVARQFDGNVFFSRYLAAIFAAFLRSSHNAAIFSQQFARSECDQSCVSPTAGITSDGVSVRRCTKAASPYTEIHDSQAYFWAHREVMPKARHANSVSF
jgi:hypothetical protein